MRLLGLIPYNLQRRAWTYSEILNVRDKVAAGGKTAVIAQRLSRTQDGGIRYGANRPRYWRPEEDAMLRRLATEGESYREIARRLGRGQYGVQNRGAMLHKGQWPETLPARRLSGCQRAAYSSSRGWWYFNHYRRRSALLYPRKTACNGRAPRPAHRAVPFPFPGAGSRTFPRGAFPSRATRRLQERITCIIDGHGGRRDRTIPAAT